MSWNVSNATRFWTLVSPSDTTALPSGETNYLYVGTSGNLTALCNGVSILFTNLAVGYHPIRCTQIFNTGTTASGIIAAN